MRVLIVEDDTTLASQLQSQLSQRGFVTDLAHDGEEGLFYALESPLDIAIVDLGLPKLSGIELIKTARAKGKNYPILILTARDRWQDKVEGLEAGGDDYLAKPFHPEELLARLNALLRRAGRWTQAQLHCGPVTLDTGSQQVFLHQQPLELTSYEFKLLEYLMLHAGETLSKSRLTEHLYDDERDSNVIEVFIRRLRKKLDPDGNLNPIETQRGQGYRFSLARHNDAP
ncbi:MAG: response regulator transcription factor [Gammaproteobacteria bacterium]|nr:response regulator transcription factor [Gammaproteobacteria bacterium]